MRIIETDGGGGAMQTGELTFVIPTYRLRDVAATIEAYDEHFFRHGHAVKMVVFDDSTAVNHEKYYPLLERTSTHNDVFYVGPTQKASFFDIVRERLRDKDVEPIVDQLFRPSYGGNRNFSLVYTLGGAMISADDDMRPYALVDASERPPAGEVCHGKVVKALSKDYATRSFDLVRAFREALGKKVRDVPASFLRGDHLIDTAMDLETNATKGLSRENALTLAPGTVDASAVVKMAQTFRSGTNDIDALDFVDMFLDDEEQSSLDVLGDLYVLQGFRPAITNRNWRMDCGVAAYDNSAGLPPFFPTHLRFEDYIYRLWIQQNGFVAAHVDAAQNHAKNPYMRNPPASEVFNEEVANFLKRKISATITALDDLGIAFGYDGAVGQAEAAAMLEKMVALHGRVTGAAKRSPNPERAGELWRFAATLEKVFYGFEPDFFQHNLQRVVREEISVIKRSMEIWPTLLEICFFHARRKGLPLMRIANSHKTLATRAGRTDAPREHWRSPMRIAQVSPLFESVPPKAYGGTERVVSWLTEELVLQGHDVTLFASGDSVTSARLVPMCPRALWSDERVREPIAHHVREVARAIDCRAAFDVLHFHTDFVQFPLIRASGCAAVNTLHGQLTTVDHGALFDEYDDVGLVSISDAQRRPIPHADWLATVHHGMPLDLHTFRPEGGDYLAFLGRASPEKGLDRAIEIACRSKTKLKVAVRICADERAYYSEVIAPLVRAAGPWVEMIGEVAGAEKDRFLGEARAMLFPIDWQEPFGLVMIEAMACGTPVIAFRNGSVSEVIDDGVSGWVVDDVAQAVAATARVTALRRAACRQTFERRFGVARMAREYVEVYRHATEARARGRRSSGVVAASARTHAPEHAAALLAGSGQAQ